MPVTVNFTTANNGTNWTVPDYSQLTVTVKGPGGGGGGGHVSGGTDGQSNPGSPGAGHSIFGSATPLDAAPGLGGTGAGSSFGGANGANGTASGGTNTTGGGAPGGPGGPGNWYGGAGGAGGKVVKTWNKGDAGAPAAGALIALTIRLGGAGGWSPDASYGSAGSPGTISVTYTPAPVVNTLAAASGSFGLSGKALTPQRAAKLALPSGVFAETGQSGQPKVGKVLPVPTGSLALSGRTLTPKTARQLPVPQGTLGLTGNPVTAGFQLSAPTAAFHVLGPEAIGNINAVLDPAALSLVGNAATFRFDWHLQAEPGDFGITPSEALPSKGFTLPGAKGIFTRSDNAATAGFGISNAPGVFHIADSAVGFVSPGNWSVVLPFGHLALTGADAQLVPGWGAIPTPARLTVTGKTAKLAIGYKCIATPGVFGLQGKEVSFPTFNANLLTGLVALAGGEAKLTKGYQLSAVPGFFNMAVNPLRTKRGTFALKGHDAAFSLGFAYTGPDQDRVLIPNDRFPLDLLLFRVLGNKEVPGFVELTLGAVQEPTPNCDQNFGLSWMGPFPHRGTAVRFNRPVKPALTPQISLFS